ncbi:site-2 protease family protein [Patescibacteria group bacterium]
MALVVGITFHEFAHAWSARMLGDPTAEQAGRLTLNPFKHLDLVGTLFLLFAGFGWGKPVPVNHLNLRNGKWGRLMVSLSGPISNLILIFVFGIALRLVFAFTALPQTNGLIIFLLALIIINIILMIFNLIPVPPLDGGELLEFFLPERAHRIKEFIQRYGFFILFFLLIIGYRVLQPIFESVINFTLRYLVGA